ncbi:hypothetical protein MXC99_14500 [Thauera aromatica]|uniref:hypothetical protein n=1 Tax=Thauera aromatica TaxID=59405 RepID=UPI001FFDE874|nr:hypothetical protein [Thauera aromatica]MCK2089380.1 hypothetical protein [Thauera aromatica]
MKTSREKKAAGSVARGGGHETEDLPVLIELDLAGTLFRAQEPDLTVGAMGPMTDFGSK